MRWGRLASERRQESSPAQRCETEACQMACPGAHVAPGQTDVDAAIPLRRFASTGAEKINTAGPCLPGPAPSRGDGPRRRLRNCHDLSDPFCGLICCPQRVHGPSEDSPGQGQGLQESEALDSIARLCLLHRILASRSEEQARRHAEATALGLSASEPAPEDAPPVLSDEQFETMFNEELEDVLGPGGDNLSGCCVGCGTSKPTIMILSQGRTCRHLVYCDDCATRHVLQTGAGSTSVPAHLWTESSCVVATCPFCKREGRLVRIWPPEDAGGKRGMCLHCHANTATVLVLRCRHLSLCTACKMALTVMVTEDGQPIVVCPACSTQGVACDVFLP